MPENVSSRKPFTNCVANDGAAKRKKPVTGLGKSISGLPLQRSMCSNQCFQLSFGGTGRPGGPYDANDYSLAVFAYDSKYCYGRMSLILADLGLSVGVRDQFAPPPSPS